MHVAAEVYIAFQSTGFLWDGGSFYCYTDGSGIFHQPISNYSIDDVIVNVFKWKYEEETIKVKFEGDDYRSDWHFISHANERYIDYLARIELRKNEE